MIVFVEFVLMVEYVLDFLYEKFLVGDEFIFSCFECEMIVCVLKVEGGNMVCVLEKFGIM